MQNCLFSQKKSVKSPKKFQKCLLYMVLACLFSNPLELRGKNKKLKQLYLGVHHKILCQEKVAELIFALVESDEITVEQGLYGSLHCACAQVVAF